MTSPTRPLKPSRAVGSFDLTQQAGQRPWLALGAAIAAGYVLGSFGDRPRASYGGHTTLAKPAGLPDWAQPAHNRQPVPTAAASWSPTQPSIQHTAAPQFDITDSPSLLTPHTAPPQADTAAGPSLLTPLQDEIEMIKTAAVTTIKSLLRDTLKDYLPDQPSRSAAAGHQAGRPRA